MSGDPALHSERINGILDPFTPLHPVTFHVLLTDALNDVMWPERAVPLLFTQLTIHFHVISFIG